jgi:soluble lytic murein transglycosylase
MAQELASMRSPAAYAGVAAYARAHSGEAGAAAYLALGHAYLLDHRYPEAAENLEKARSEGESLDDYAVFLEGQADMQAGKLADAQTVLTGFAEKYPESIFVANLPVVMANLALGQGDPQAALTVLNGHPEASGHADYLIALARASQLAGNTDEAARLYRRIYLNYPLSSEGQQAKTQLAVIGAAAPLTIEERRAHADALYAGGRYAEAAEEYRSLASDPGDTVERVKNALRVAAAACDFKLKRLSTEQAESLPDSADESGARRLYLMVELARNRDDSDTQEALVEQLKTRFPASPWLAEALYTSGNMYLLRKDYPQAIGYYTELSTRFPQNRYAPSSHWKAAWLSYQTGNYSDAARLIDEQLTLFAGGKEISAALYWRGRLYEDQDHKPEMAAAYYSTLSNAFDHYYYAQLARGRLSALGKVAPADAPLLANIGREPIPPLTDDVPNDDEHVVKARLLANAGLNEYIPAEIQAADGSRQWGAFAEAEIYASYGEAYRAMQILKRALPFYASAPLDSIPVGYWKILFPQPYWETIEQQSAKNNLDPYMVASLIRQESEFNAGAVSRADALGLMQLLPSVGRSMAKEEGDRHFREDQLLDPDTNIRLGTRYLGQILSKFGGKPEYAFAAYNAGDDRVANWREAGSYNGMDEFVESIPFTETREYVQAILRNEAIYRELNQRLSGGKPPVNAVAQQQ